MKKLLMIILVLTFCLVSQSSPTAQTTSPTKFKGFLGTYHPVNGTAYGGSGWREGELMQHAFNFGQNAILVKGSHLKYTFEENINNSCREWDVNKIYGILLPPSEYGEPSLFNSAAAVPGNCLSFAATLFSLRA